MSGRMDLFDRYRVIDVDAHVTEPADLWTARVSSRWGDRVPHIERLGDKDVWMVAGRPVGAQHEITEDLLDRIQPIDRLVFGDHVARVHR